MAYNEPTLRSTGDLITAAIWNADIRDNFIDHETRLLAAEIFEVSAPAEIDCGTNTTYATKRTDSIPGGTLAAVGDMLRVFFKTRYDGTTGSDTADVKMTFGGQTVCNNVSVIRERSNANERAGLFFLDIVAVDDAGNSNNIDGYAGSRYQVAGIDHDEQTVTVDYSQNQDLVLQTAWDATPSGSLFVMGYTVMKVAGT